MRLVALAVAMLGCGPGAGTDAGAPLDAAAVCVPPAELDAVDLLFVVDATETLSVAVDSFPPSPSNLPSVLLGDRRWRSATAPMPLACRSRRAGTG